MKDYQKKLFPYAYNILGSSDDAKDAVQDVIIKYISAPKRELENEMGYLVKSVINQALNIKKRNKRTISDHIGLPEPIATEFADGNIKKQEIISYSMLVLLDRLNPKERAVFILKEAFDHGHDEIADVLSISIENSRKLLSRAKAKLDLHKEVMVQSAMDHSAHLQNYIRVIRNRDISALEKMLSEDIRVMADGGSNISIVSELTIGITAAAQLMVYVYDTYQQQLDIKLHEINHHPALLFYDGDTLINCQVFEFEEGTDGIKGIYSIVDPEKLKNIFNN